MAEPTVAAEPTIPEPDDDEAADDDDPEEPHDEPEEPEPETPELPDADEVAQAEAVVEEDDFDSGGLFSGVEESNRTDDDTEATDDDVADAFDDVDLGGDDDTEQAAGMDQPDLASSGIADTINEGAARLAVVGLDDPEKSDLEAEFVEVFEAFQLGKNGARFADEYLMVEGEQVDPAWALASTAMACALFAIYMRPDRDEQLEKLAQAVGGIGGGSIDDLHEFDDVDL